MKAFLLIKPPSTACPLNLRPGHPDFVGTAALAAALDYLTSIGIDKIAAYEHELLQYATENYYPYRDYV